MRLREPGSPAFPSASTLIPAVLLAAACAASTGSSRQPPDGTRVAFDTGTALIISDGDTVQLDVEIASTPAQHEVGLMERTDLAGNAGMLFIFAETQDAESGFWMYRTRIPLDAAFIDGDGRIVSVRSMSPCPHDDQDACDKYLAGVPWRMALEVNGGFFARHGIGVGDRFLLVRR